jgi:hypothetical protein
MKLLIKTHMQNIKIEVKVALASGASVGLTDSQTNQIRTFINSILFTEAVKEKRTYTRRKGTKRAWTAEEDALLLPLVGMTNKADSMKYYKKIKRQINRGSSAMYSRVSNMRKAAKTSIPVTTWL